MTWIILLVICVVLYLYVFTRQPVVGGGGRATWVLMPNQLFDSPKLNGADVYLVEDPAYFDRVPFHKLKLVFHRASMKKYAKRRKEVKYIDYKDYSTFENTIRGKTIHMFDTADSEAEARYGKLCDRIVAESPAFILSRAEVAALKSTKYSHAEFYKHQRKKLNILMDGDKPVGGKWSYDEENRGAGDEYMAESGGVSPVHALSDDDIQEAIAYVQAVFPTNPGKLTEGVRGNYLPIHYYPLDRPAALARLDEFIDKLEDFGHYQDAVCTSQTPNCVFGFHSVLSSSINCGLLNPMEPVNAVMDVYRAAGGRKELLPSVEGFIRQLIGWREYSRAMYVLEGDKMRASNYWGAKNKLSDAWWNATTGISIIDNIIRSVNLWSYAHHIQRLMYLAAPMMMLMVHPDQIYEWFLSMVSIDAYDWVMVPNVYGMGSYADGGLMMSRPYFSSGKYAAKMMDKPLAKPDEEKWTAIYYNFIKNKKHLMKDYHSARWVSNWERKSETDKAKLITLAKQVLKSATQD